MTKPYVLAMIEGYIFLLCVPFILIKNKVTTGKWLGKEE